MGRGEPTSDGVLAFLDEVHALMLADDPRVRLIGHRTDAASHLEQHAEAPQRRGWNMQWTLSATAVVDNSRANALAAAHGTDLRLVAPPQAFARAPLNVQVRTPVRVGPVPFPLLVADEVAFLAGPYGTRLSDTFWAAVDPVLVEKAASAFLAVWESAVPLADADVLEPLPPRTFEVALRLVDGWSDKQIADELGVSQRTVSAEVQRVVQWVGARSRGHAVALLVGAG